MANTISVMTNAVRGVVSKKRIRYQENGYDLDLACKYTFILIMCMQWYVFNDTDPNSLHFYYRIVTESEAFT